MRMGLSTRWSSLILAMGSFTDFTSTSQGPMFLKEMWVHYYQIIYMDSFKSTHSTTKPLSPVAKTYFQIISGNKYLKTTSKSESCSKQRTEWSKMNPLFIGYWRLQWTIKSSCQAQSVCVHPLQTKFARYSSGWKLAHQDIYSIWNPDEH